MGMNVGTREQGGAGDRHGRRVVGMQETCGDGGIWMCLAQGVTVTFHVSWRLPLPCWRSTLPYLPLTPLVSF